MAIKFANCVNMTLASDLAAADTSLTVTAGQGSQCPAIAAADANYMLLCITDKDGNKEIIKVIEHLSGTDVFTIGDDESVPHSASVNGRAYEATYDGYQTALAITATDDHKITLPITATSAESAMSFSAVTASVSEISLTCDGNTASAAEITSVCDGNTATAAEIKELHSAGAVSADFVKLHALTSTATELNILDADNRAIGDIITEISAGTMGAIAAVAVGQYLKSAGVATKPAWGKLALSDTGIKIGTFTITDTSNTITGVGFQPSVVILLSVNQNGNAISIGSDNVTAQGCIYYESSTWAISTGYSIITGFSNGSISAFSSDGFSTSQTYTVGDSTVIYIAFP